MQYRSTGYRRRSRACEREHRDRCPDARIAACFWCARSVGGGYGRGIETATKGASCMRMLRAAATALARKQKHEIPGWRRPVSGIGSSARRGRCSAKHDT